MKKIAVEEHFITRESLDMICQVMTGKYADKKIVELEKSLDIEHMWDPVSRLAPFKVDWVVDLLADLGEARVQAMDNAKLDVQVLSHISPGAQVLNAADGTHMASKCNDLLARAISKYPDRFAGLASLAPQDPDLAAKELERAVKKLKLKGAVINSHTRGEYLDEKKYWVILEAAESLGVPIYLHPRSPSSDVIKPYAIYPVLASAMLGFCHDVSLHVMRMMIAGVFDRFPKLVIVLGHMGETLPHLQWRMDNHWIRLPFSKNLKKTPSQYLKDNFYVTTSGMFSHIALVNGILSSGADNILFAIDYPLEDMRGGIEFIDTAPICTADKEKICHLNAERVFKL